MNINQLMKQAQVMQKKMKEMQEEIASKQYVGKSGGGLVTVSMSGSGEMLKVSLDLSFIVLLIAISLLKGVIVVVL